MAGTFRFEPCPTCCEGCTYFLDDFNRADIGDDWTVAVGTAAIVSNELKFTTAVSRADCLIENPEADPELRLVVKVKLTANSALAEIYLDNLSALLELERLDTDHAEIRLTTTGTATETVAWDTVEQKTITVCVGTERIAVMVGASLIHSATYTATSSLVSVGSAGTNNSVFFDDFQLDYNHELHPQCPACDYPCDPCTSTAPAQLKVVISGVTAYAPYCCNDLNGTFYLDIVDACTWAYDLPSDLCDDTAAWYRLVVVLTGEMLAVQWLPRSYGYGRCTWMDLTPDLSCADWSDYSVAMYNPLGAACNHASSTCLLSAV